MKFGICRQGFIKVSSVRLRGNPPNRTRADTCPETDGHGEDSENFLATMSLPIKTTCLTK